ncbi:MAG: AI-2E family transporter [Chloroflexota bacterium]
MKRLAQITAVVLIVVIGALALWQMREAVQLLIVALAVASGLEPVAQRLARRGMNRARAVVLAFVAVLALLGTGVLLFGSLISTEIALLAERLPVWYDLARTRLIESGGQWRSLAESLPSADVLTARLASEQSGDVMAIALGALAGAATLVTAAVVAVTLGIYWLLDRQRIERLWLSILPLDARTTARAVWTQVYDEVGLYVRGESVIVALSAVALLSVYAALGVPGAATLAAIGGLAQVVPLLGLPIAAALGVIAALTRDMQTAALTLAGTLYVLGVIKLVIGPRVFRGGVNVNPVLVMFLIIALADIGGVWMVLLAPPLAAALQASVRVLANEQRVARVGDPVRAAALRAKLDAVEAEISRREVTDPRLLDLLGRARRLVEEAGGSLPEPPPEGLPPDPSGARAT